MIFLLFIFVGKREARYLKESLTVHVLNDATVSLPEYAPELIKKECPLVMSE
jgi:hypothetical protein